MYVNVRSNETIQTFVGRSGIDDSFYFCSVCSFIAFNFQSPRGGQESICSLGPSAYLAWSRSCARLQSRTA